MILYNLMNIPTLKCLMGKAKTETAKSNLEIILDGEVILKEPSLSDYEEYKKEEIKKQLIKQTIDKLDKISPSMGLYDIYGNNHKQKIAQYLVEKEFV